MKSRSKFRFFKLIICAVAVLNLVALFVFEYKFPFDTFFAADNPDTTEQISTETQSTDYSISFDSDTLNYDGSYRLDLMRGVTLTGPKGSVDTSKVFVNIVTGDSLNEKTVTYTMDTEQGQVSASRKLILDNYTAPSITLPTNLPTAEEADLDNYISLMPTDGSFSAKDGFGNDISSQISLNYTIDAENPSIVHLSFSVTNMFNDSVSVPADISISSQRPILVLKQSSVTIEKGSAFQPLDYVKKAVSQSGKNLIDTIKIEGSVDANTPGKYTLKLSISDSGIGSIPQKLEVVVE